MPRKGLLKLISIIVLVGLLASTGIAIAQGPDTEPEVVNEPTVFARVDGKVMPLTEGMALNTTNGYEIFGKGDKYYSYGSITLKSTGNGFEVTDITWSAKAPPESPEMSSVGVYQQVTPQVTP